MPPGTPLRAEPFLPVHGTEAEDPFQVPSQEMLRSYRFPSREAPQPLLKKASAAVPLQSSGPWNPGKETLRFHPQAAHSPELPFSAKAPFLPDPLPALLQDKPRNPLSLLS